MFRVRVPGCRHVVQRRASFLCRAASWVVIASRGWLLAGRFGPQAIKHGILYGGEGGAQGQKWSGLRIVSRNDTYLPVPRWRAREAMRVISLVKRIIAASPSTRTK